MKFYLNLNFKDLREQKAALLKLRESNESEASMLSGVIHIIDEIQDQAAGILGEEIVFNFKEE